MLQKIIYLIIGVGVTALIPMTIIQIAMRVADRKEEKNKLKYNGKSSIQNQSNNRI